MALQFPCSSCGASVEYAPGTTTLQCPFCQAPQAIPFEAATAEEMDLEKALTQQEGHDQTIEVLAAKCGTCGAESTLPPNVTADKCPFCGSAVVLSGQSVKRHQPRSLLPFKVTTKEAGDSFQKWVRGLWFAPNRLVKDASAGLLAGVYLPYWTVDASTESRYAGMRGDNYQEHQTYTTTENGRTVQKTRTVTKIRWRPAAGVVRRAFDDVLVPATTSLSTPRLEALEPWDLPALVEYGEAFLSGFRVESYGVDLRGGYQRACQRMEKVIRHDVERDIGGDHQKILSLHTRRWGVTYKHILLPVWISSYRFSGKLYQFLVNGRTGEVQGDRPWSWVKITLAVVAVVAAIAAFIVFNQRG